MAPPWQDTASPFLYHFDSLLRPRHVTFFHTMRDQKAIIIGMALAVAIAASEEWG
jgi:hypothetical protein